VTLMIHRLKKTTVSSSQKVSGKRH